MERRPNRGQARGEGPISRAVSRTTGTRPERPEWIEGVFHSESVAEMVAAKLRLAFPDREVTVEQRHELHRVKVRPRL